MDVNLINPFLNATLNVLETMAFVKAEAEKPFLKQDNVAQGDVSGIVGITGAVKGTVTVTFDEFCILKIDGVVKSPIYCVVVFFQTLGILHVWPRS